MIFSSALSSIALSSPCPEQHPQIPHLGDYTVMRILEDRREVKEQLMQASVLQFDDFQGTVKLSSQPRHSFYSYSLWRTRTGEHLFDGAAGDLVEALESMRAHIRHLCAKEGTPE